MIDGGGADHWQGGRDSSPMRGTRFQRFQCQLPRVLQANQIPCNYHSLMIQEKFSARGQTRNRTEK